MATALFRNGAVSIGQGDASLSLAVQHVDAVRVCRVGVSCWHYVVVLVTLCILWVYVVLVDNTVCVSIFRLYRHSLKMRRCSGKNRASGGGLLLLSGCYRHHCKRIISDSLLPARMRGFLFLANGHSAPFAPSPLLRSLILFIAARFSRGVDGSRACFSVCSIVSLSLFLSTDQR